MQDGSTFEIEQRITEDSLVSCPTTGQKVERVLQPFTPRYRGTGFYSTDHRKPKAKEQPRGVTAERDTGAHAAGVSSRGDAMPWLADTDVGAAYGFARAMVGARTEAELRRRALQALAELVPADVLTWDRVELATGAVRPRGGPGRGGARRRLRGARRARGRPSAAGRARGPPAPRSAVVGARRAPDRSPTASCTATCSTPSGVEYEIAIGMRTGRGEAVVAGLGRTEREFSERDRDVLDIARPGLEGALRATQARGRLVRALAADPPPGTAVVLLDRDGEIELSSVDAERWLAEHFGAAEHPGWLPGPVAEWLALPPRPPLVSDRDGRRLTVCLLPGDPHALLLEEAGRELPPRGARSPRPDARARPRCCARPPSSRTRPRLAWELFLSLHAVRERLAHLEAKLGVRTAGDAVARALRESA